MKSHFETIDFDDVVWVLTVLVFTYTPNFEAFQETNIKTASLKDFMLTTPYQDTEDIHFALPGQIAGDQPRTPVSGPLWIVAALSTEIMTTDAFPPVIAAQINYLLSHSPLSIKVTLKIPIHLSIAESLKISGKIKEYCFGVHIFFS